MIRTIARKAALSIPQIRRVFEFAREQACRADALANELAIAQSDIGTLTGEMAVVVEERDSLDLQLYVLRSDHQRLISRSEAFREELNQLHDRLADHEAATPFATTDLDHLHARLAARLTLGFGALSTELRSLMPLGADAATPRLPGLYLDLLVRSLAVEVGTPDAAVRLNGIRVLAERVLAGGVPGDVLQAGTLHHEAGLLLRGILAAHGATDRCVILLDSTAPDADPMSGDAVRARFASYGLLDAQTRFAEPAAQAENSPLAMAVLDITLAAPVLDALYARIATGGFLVVPGNANTAQREAMVAFRAARGITEEIEEIDGAGAFWRKGA